MASRSPLRLLRSVAGMAMLLIQAGYLAAQDSDRPAIARPDPAVAPASDQRPDEDPTRRRPQDSQYTKNASPTGLAIGVLDKEVDDQGLPEELEILAKQGAMASAKQDWDRAREVYQKMIHAAPRNALAFANLGIVEYRVKNYEAARAALRRSLQLNPGISQNWITLGLVYHREQSYELAIASLARALHEDPSDPRAHLYMAVVINDYGWGPAAVTELQRAIQIDPNYADAHFNLALMYLEQEPPAVELARRHYYMATDLGAAPDDEIEKLVSLKSGDDKAPPLVSNGDEDESTSPKEESAPDGGTR